MSEFECSRGHLVCAPYHRCQICEGRVIRMDGYSSRELAMLDRIVDGTCIEKEASYDREAD